MSTLYYESSFAHHGVKGMKWGVRRFQNKDGSLTDQGRHRVREIIKEKASDKNPKTLANKIRDMDKKINENPLIKANSDFAFKPGLADFYLSEIKTKRTKDNIDDIWREARSIYYKDLGLDISTESKKAASLFKKKDWLTRDFVDSLITDYSKKEIRSIDSHNARAYNWDATTIARQELAPIRARQSEALYKLYESVR